LYTLPIFDEKSKQFLHFVKPGSLACHCAERGFAVQRAIPHGVAKALGDFLASLQTGSQ
jgi:hypothetical protein